MLESASHFLTNARLTRDPLPGLPADCRPRTPEEGYQIQARHLQHLLAHYGGRFIGYKIGCTNPIAQEFLKVSEPFYGRMLAATTFDSPARLSPGEFSLRIIESEFAFQFARDLPPLGRPAARDEIVDALAGVLPGIEIVDSRFTEWTAIGAPCLIADNGCHGAWVKGTLVTNWRGIDLAAQAVELSVNGKVTERGTGAAVLGHPLNALHWLVDRLHAQGIPLFAGDYVTTGVTTGIYNAQPGDHLIADFGSVGRVPLTFPPP